MGAFLNGVMPETAPTVGTNWTVVPAFPNLLFTNLMGVLPVPGTNLLCAWEREGRVWTFATNSTTSTKKLVLDISNQCQGWDDCGMMSVAFHPGFLTNGYVFIYYTWVTPGTVTGGPSTHVTEHVTGRYHDRLARFTMTNGILSAASETLFVDQIGNSAWHNGGAMFFHPTNGFLYYTDGDDEDAPTQVIDLNLFSGVFRIDVDKRGGSVSHTPPRQPYNGTTTNYYIPNDNPFVGQANVLEEYFCLGLRSPHRMTYDPPTGKIYLGDVGDASREEVDIIYPGESGLNFQWKVIEGLNGDLTSPYPGINRRPVMDYTHVDGLAVIGGYVYRGSEFAGELGGSYIFGDSVSRTIWVMNESTNPATKLAIATVPRGAEPPGGSDYTGLSSFGLDANGEIFMCQMSSVGGQIFKLAHGSATASRPLPTLLSQTGTFTNFTTLAPNPGLVPYTVNSPLWSDAAIKTRWMALATNASVTFATNGEWTFPNGTVFVKHFELATNELNSSQRRRLETRLLAIGTNGLAYGATYRWRLDGSDADIVYTATNEVISITTATGTRTQTWSYPGRADCLVCHTIPSGAVLGVKTRQLNGSYIYPNTTNALNQLLVWNLCSLFSSNLNVSAITNYDKLVPITDTNATLTTRVRSYLDANCAHCHRPGGGVQANFDARFDTPLTNQNLILGTLFNSQGVSNAYVIAPGDVNRSMLYLRDSNVGGALQMPPLAKNLQDTNYITVLSAWIQSMAAPTISAIADVTVTPGGSSAPLAFTVSDPAFPASSLIVTGTSANTNLVPNANIIFGGSGSNRTVTVTPALGQSGSTTITVQVNDGSASAYDTFVVTVPGLLVGWYRFETNALDSSGFGNHGSAAGGVSYGSGKTGGAVTFNGADGYIQIPALVSNDFTLAFWIKTTAFGSGPDWWAGRGMLDGEMAGTGSDYGTSLVVDRVAFGVGNPDTTILSASTINNGNWRHVAATRNATNGEVKLYIDGVLENSLVTTAIGARLPDNLRFGSIRSGVIGGYLAGSFDDARIYNYVLGASEIATLLNLSNQPPVLAAISNRVIMAGTILLITNTATGNGPFTYSLTAYPSGAGINATNGIFTWRPTMAQGGTTNAINVQVADSGAPVLTDAKSFSVIVNRPATPGFGTAGYTNRQFRLTITGDYGPDYTVLSSTNLTAWTAIFSTNQPVLPFQFLHTNATGERQRFYRVRLDP